ncbi:hypothetical protein [Acinetobacter sp.]|uniref:hypothetical protein n=1 Tax=Acinetobacter sp. TaxID=472 RepID=UPI003751C7FB
MAIQPTQPVKPKSVRQLFSDPARWIKRDSSKIKKIKGKEVLCFCMTGAIDHIYPYPNPKNAIARKRVKAAIELYELGKFDPDKGIEGWNDQTKRNITDVQRVVAIAKI